MKGGWKKHKAYCRMSNPEKWQFMVQNAQPGEDLAFTSMSRIISSEGVDLNAVDKYGWTMMHRMTETNENAFVKLLLEAGASADLPLQGIAGAPPSALMMCVMNIFDNASDFPQGGKVDLARILIDHGADLDAVFTCYGEAMFTPLTAAIHYNCPVIADMLIDAGASVEHCCPLRAVSFNSNLPMVMKFLSLGVMVDNACEDGTTALMSACDSQCEDDEQNDSRREIQCSKCLISFKKKRYLTQHINRGNCKGVNNEEISLHTQDEIVRLLLNAGANVDKCNAKGEDALSLAYKFGREDAIKILKDAGAIMNRDAFNAAHSLAVLCGFGNAHFDYLAIELLDAGVDINGVEDSYNATRWAYNATQWARRWNRTWLLNELLRRGGKL
jgi:ankyrin repeat protein